MVEARPEPGSLAKQFEEMRLEGADAELMDDLRRIMNNPKYLDSAEDEIEKMLKDAKVSLTQLGYDIDKERLANI